MVNIMKLRKILGLLVVSLFLPSVALAGVPQVSQVMVTDVTTKSFSVIWAASEACTGDLEVFEDESGLFTVDNAVISPHPVNSGDSLIREAAEDNGVMKVMVAGLEPDTDYYFKTVTASKETDDITYSPESNPYIWVRTESETVRTTGSGESIVPFSNDVIIQPCYLDDGVSPADGTLLLATIEGANYPLTAFVGDGVDAPNALIDLNNVFGLDSHENIDLIQGENLTLLNFRGMAGNSIITYEVPEDFSLSEVKPPALVFKAGWNMVSFQLEPDDTNINNVISSIDDSIDAVWGYDASTQTWSSLDKNIPPILWDLSELHSLSGYWFVMNSEASLMVNGNFISSSIQLHPGWNLVGSKSIETILLMDAIAPIFDKINAVWTFNAGENKWYSYDKNIPPVLNDLFTMEPGKAYWFVMDSTCAGNDCQW